MIGLISSTIFPPNLPSHDEVRTWISSEERLKQTQATINSLFNVGISDVYLADNSGDDWLAEANNLLRPAHVYVFNQHQYQNKGISELYLLLSMLKHLPSNVSILKISGRYVLKKDLSDELADADLAVKIHKYGMFKSSISTRCYIVKNKQVYEDFLRHILQETYAYSTRIVGPRSLVRILANSLFPKIDSYPYNDPRWAIELAGARVLKKHNYKVSKIETLGVEGISGAFKNIKIVE